MARLGTFDLTANAPTWVDATADPNGWFTDDLVPAPTSVAAFAPAGIETGEQLGPATFVAVASPSGTPTGEAMGAEEQIAGAGGTALPPDAPAGSIAGKFSPVGAEQPSASAGALGTGFSAAGTEALATWAGSLTITITPAGTQSGEALGPAQLVQVLLLEPAGIPSGEALGPSSLSILASLAGVEPLATGSPALDGAWSLTAIGPPDGASGALGGAMTGSVEPPGAAAGSISPTFALSAIELPPASAGTWETLATGSFAAEQTWAGALGTAFAGTIETGEAPGPATFSVGGAVFAPAGIESGETVGPGSLQAIAAWPLEPAGIESAEALGAFAFEPQPVPPPVPVPARKRPVFGSAGPVASFNRRTDYALLPLDGEAAVLALADGSLRFAQTPQGLVAELLADDGTRYVYGKLGRQARAAGRVKKGDTIAFQQAAPALPAPGVPAPEPTLPAATYGVLALPVGASGPPQPDPHVMAVARDAWEAILLGAGVGTVVVIVVVAVQERRKRVRSKR